MSKLIKMLHTVRKLKGRQIAYRIYYRFHKPRLYTGSAPNLRNVLLDWSGLAYMSPATNDGKTFTFLGASAQLQGDWNASELPKLWLYNLHYHDDLNAIGADGRFELCRLLIDGWIAGNPPLHGNGWESYCISLRVVNWVKWFSRISPQEIKLEWLESLATQVDALDQRLEYHILANHLFANAKALVFAGAFFGGQQGDKWLRRGLQLLDQELEEQFLADGAHYELSPMYHAILLWDIADLICLQQSTLLPALTQRVAGLGKRFIAGFRWLLCMVHPDQDLSFFNDATLGVAPTLDDFVRYAAKLKLGVNANKVASTDYLQGRLLESSGYAVIDWPRKHRLIADVGSVGPDYQPGHAHADTLSCELSLFGQRVFVNSGISMYGEGAERHRQRSTAVHNTLEVDSQNSSEVWAGFRVARRARPFDVLMQVGDERVSLQASHDGYCRLAGKVIHQRYFIAEPARLNITDELTGRFEQAVVFWHLHPGVELERLDHNSFKLILPQSQMLMLSIKGADVEVCSSTWHPGFGKSVSNKKLVLKLSGRTLMTQLTWSSD